MAATRYASNAGFDTAFSVDTSHITFGAGCLREAGDVASDLGMTRVGLLTDPVLAQTQHVKTVEESLVAAGLAVVIYDQVRVEPTDASFAAAADFVASARVDGLVSVGGGSVMDTTKAANLYSVYPAPILTYVNAPIGEGAPVPGPLKPHIACPTTSGTGSECTGIAVLDVVDLEVKVGIQNQRIRPTRALIDPNCTRTLPASVVASAGFDVLNHALESYTARPFTRREPPARPTLRPASQGANPWSDLGSTETLRLLGHYLVRGVRDPTDTEARHALMWAASLAGIAFSNSGCHAAHAMSYAVAGLVKDYRPDGYPTSEPMVPHGMSVVLNSPSVFRLTARANPSRHLHAAALLGADHHGIGDQDAGNVLAGQIISLMQATGMPNGLTGVGYEPDDVPGLVDRAGLQRGLLANAPIEIDHDTLTSLFEGALSYW
ncbi:MAG: iron-containing alcohol dehydrogenase [Acidimicrobiia bacterium]|nr:iron-containing alcohol dehydrogenase [Acidimicrobiia bacterium]